MVSTSLLSGRSEEALQVVFCGAVGVHSLMGYPAFTVASVHAEGRLEWDVNLRPTGCVLLS